MDFATFQTSVDGGGAARKSARCRLQELPVKESKRPGEVEKLLFQFHLRPLIRTSKRVALRQSTSSWQGLLRRRRASSYSRRKSL